MSAPTLCRVVNAVFFVHFWSFFCCESQDDLSEHLRVRRLRLAVQVHPCGRLASASRHQEHVPGGHQQAVGPAHPVVHLHRA